jgi:uncharacterized membrane protein YidH (DUF202 family)
MLRLSNMPDHDPLQNDRDPQPAADGPAIPARVVSLLAKLVELGEKQARAIEEQNDLARDRTGTTSTLARYSSRTAENADKQTGLAQERTALTREQTRLSTRSSELAEIRTGLARERTFQTQERTQLAAQRTDMAHRRTMLADWRTRLARRRTQESRERTLEAVARTRLSAQRTELARARTFLALARTGLAFLTLGLTLFRYFGLSRWSFFDGALVMFSIALLYAGASGYRRSKLMEKKLADLTAADQGVSLGPLYHRGVVAK